MDLFGPTSVSSLNHKWYCLVVTDDFSRFTWTFFLKTKNETSSILRNFITEIENLKDLKVKIIRCDNGGEFKNREMDEFCTKKGIKREFSNARTPQQNGVAERRNKTLIEAVRTISPAIGFLRPFGCHVMILNTLDNLGKFDAKGDEGYFVGYSLSSKAFRVFNKRTNKVEENLHVDFLESKPMEKGVGLDWLFNIDTLTKLMNYTPIVVAGTSSTNISAHMETSNDSVRNNEAKDDPSKEQDSNADVSESMEIEVPTVRPSIHTATTKDITADQVEPILPSTVQTKVPAVSLPTAADSLSIPTVSSSVPRIISRGGSSYPETPSLGNAMTFEDKLEDFFGDTTNSASLTEMKADLSNMETGIQVSLTPTLRINKDHLKNQIIGPIDTPIQTRHRAKNMEDQGFIATIHQKTDPDLLQYCLFSCFLSQEEPKKIFDALKDPRVRPIGTKWVLKNKRDERGIVIRNKARLVAQEYTQEEGIDYKEVFAPIARIEAIRLFLAYASYMGFTVYQMDVKSAFLYGTIDEDVYVKQTPGFEDPEFPDKVYRVEKAMYGLHQSLRAWYGTLSKYLLDNGFQRCTIDQTLFIRNTKENSCLSKCELTFFLGLQVLQKKDGIFISQDKYMGDIIMKFGYTDVRIAKTPMDRENPCGKDRPGKAMDLHLYRSMIGSLMYLTVSRPDIMFVMCVCARHQVTPKECHLHAVKRILDDNVADLLTKSFDVGRFQYLVVEHAMTSSVLCINNGFTSYVPMLTDIEEKDEKRSQNDKTGHGMEKQEKDKVQSNKKPEKVNKSQPKSTPKPKVKKNKFEG
ncbi:hypothetical protein Tco_0091564 [Tanacetum coccineum]